MRKLPWIIAFLGFPPCCKADTLPVTSGHVQIIGATGNNVSLSGDGFTATGSFHFVAAGCIAGAYAPGQPILGCAGTQFPIGLTNEDYTITAPEPRTSILLLIAIACAFVMRKRAALGSSLGHLRASITIW